MSPSSKVNNGRMLVIDANNLCQIQRHAFGDDLSYEDELTGVLWGFFNQIIKLAERFDTNRFVFAWDSRQRKRKHIYPEYKANRTADPDADPGVEGRIRHQFRMLRTTLLRGFGFKNGFWATGFEADDVIASIVRDPENQELDPIVVSTDKDLWQLLDCCEIFRPVNKERMTADDLSERFPGITPQTWVKLRSMTGDVSDGIPGIEGVGEKTAMNFIGGNIKPGSKAYKRIVNPDSQVIMERNRQLMELPLPGTPIFTLDWNETFELDDFLTICDRYGFKHFLKSEELRKWRERFNMVD